MSLCYIRAICQYCTAQAFSVVVAKLAMPVLSPETLVERHAALKTYTEQENLLRDTVEEENEQQEVDNSWVDGTETSILVGCSIVIVLSLSNTLCHSIAQGHIRLVL